MKKVLLTFLKNTSVILVLTATILGPFQPLIAQAQDAAGFVGAINSDGSVNTSQTPQQVISNSNTLNAETQANVNNGSLQAQSTAAGITGASTSGTSGAIGGGSSIGTPSYECSLTQNWSLCITNVVYVFTVGIGSGFAYVSAYFFDWAVSLSLNGTAYALDFVSRGWTTARDLANMAFLFILLYIAFKIIFEADTSDTVHMLVLVIIIALLVNFSFFFTRLAIDAGNILAIQFYNAIDAPTLASTAAGGGAQGNVLNALNTVTPGANLAGNSKDLTASIMSMLNLQGLFSTNSFNQWYAPGGDPSKGPGFMVVLISLSFLYIAAGIMFWLLTVAFITNGVKFLYRIVILWFLIIASPLAFVARAMPKMSGYFDKWLDALIKHSFYPVAFMFIFLMLSNFAQQMACTTATTCSQSSLVGGLFAGLQGANAASPVAAIAIAAANVLIRLGFVIAMLYIGMKAADTIGVMGADAAKHAGNWMGGKMIGTYGAAGRNTVGWAAYRASNAGWARKLETKTGLLAPFGVLGRGFRATTGAVGKASFDARGVAGAKSLLKDAGKAQKGGFESAAKAAVEAKEKKLKAVEPSDAQKVIARQKAEKESPDYAAVKSAHEKTRDEANKQIVNIDTQIETINKTGVKTEAEKKEKKEKIEALREERTTKQATSAISTRALKALEEVTQKRAKAISGEGLKNAYADVLSKPNIRNMWLPFRTSKEAAAKVRKGDSNEKKVLDAAKKALKEAEEESPPATAPTVTIPPAGDSGH